jgi:hypothetical protein
VLAALWFWIIFMSPIAVAVIVGVIATQVRSSTPATS